MKGEVDMKRCLLYGMTLLLLAVSAGAQITKPEVLPQTSTNGPGVAFPTLGQLMIAWTGTGNNQLNFIQNINGTWGQKVTSSQTSPSSPALAYFQNNYYV